MEPALRIATKIKADKRSKIPTAPSSSFELFNIIPHLEEAFNPYNKLNGVYKNPSYESYPKVLTRKLKNFTSDDANTLLRLVVSVILCPINQDPAMTSKFLAKENSLLKRIFGNYMSSASIDAVIIGFRDRDHDIFEEINQEIIMTKGDHPLYPKQDFESQQAFEEWKENRLNELSRKMKILEKSPQFTGKLSVKVTRALGLDPNGFKAADTKSIYYIIKVAENSQRTFTYITNSWDPEFEDEEFTFDVPSRDCRIKIELWDKGFIGSTFLGCVMTKPKDLMWADQPVERWWNLGSRTRTKDTGIVGQLFIKFNLVWRIGPYRKVLDDSSKKLTFSSFFNSSTSSSTTTSSTKTDNSTVSNNSMQAGSDSTTQKYASRSRPLSTDLSGNNSEMALPAPPPFINSRLNNYTEWFASLLYLCSMDAYNNPPEISLDSVPRISPAVPIVAPNASTIPSSPYKFTSTLITPGPGLQIPRNQHFDRYNGSNLDRSYDSLSNSFEKPSYLAQSSDTHDLNNIRNSATLSFLTATNTAGNESPRNRVSDFQSTNSTFRDGLTSSTGSISRSSPNLRSNTPSKRSLRSGNGQTNQMSSSPNSHLFSPSFASLEEESITAPVKCSEEVQWLMDNFVDRFSVDQCYSKLVQLEVLSSSFAPQSLAHLEAIHTCLIELEAQKATKCMRWIRVSQMYERIVLEDMKTRLDDALCHYFLRFPKNEPKGALSLAIILYSLITKSELPQLCLLLHDKIESTMIKMYKAVIGEKITEASLLDATKFVSLAIEQDHKFFNEVFPSDMLLTSFSIRTYYSELLTKNVKSWLRTSPPISENTMTLYANLGKLNQQISKLQSGLELIPLQSLFQPFVGKWIEKVGETLPQWCKSDLLKRETWKSGDHDIIKDLHSSYVQKEVKERKNGSEDKRASRDSSDNTKPSEKMLILHAPSVQILFEAIYRIYYQYRQFDMRTPKDLKALNRIVIQAITAYLQVMATKVVEVFEVQGQPSWNRSSPRIYDGQPSMSKLSSSTSIWSLFGITPSKVEKSSKLSHSVSLFQIPPEGCVWISTIETLTQKLYDYCKQLQSDGERGSEDVRQHFSDTFSQMLQLESQIGQLIIKLINTNPSLELSLDTLLSYSPDVDKITDQDVLEKLEPLFDYLNSRVEVLASNLDYKVFLRLLEQICLVLLKDIEVLLFPVVTDKKADAKRAQFVEFAFPYLVKFLESHGDGLPKDFLDIESSVLKVAFGMLKLPSSVLIKAYNDIMNGLAPTGIHGATSIDSMVVESHIIAVLSMRKNDKDAKKFVKLNKINTMNRMTLKAFDLPKGETVVDCFPCRKGKDYTISGYLYITTNFLCFDTNLWGDHQLIIPIADIQSLKRKKTALSTSFGLSIHLRDGSTVIQFYGLNKPKVYGIIVEQAEKQGLVLEVYDKSAANASASGLSPAASPTKRATKEKTKELANETIGDDCMKIAGAKQIDNEEDMKSHFGLQKFDEAVVAFDCFLSKESKSQEKATISSSPKASISVSFPGTLYLFSRTMCFRGTTSKIALPWANISHLGQATNQTIRVVTKEKKKTKQYSLHQFEAGDQVFALMHGLWVKCKGDPTR